MVTIKLNEKQSKALISALNELHNSGDWAEHYSEEEVDIDYQRWREYIQGLYRQDLTPMNRMIIESEFKQNPEYFQRLNKEINE